MINIGSKVSGWHKGNKFKGLVRFSYKRNGVLLYLVDLFEPVKLNYRDSEQYVMGVPVHKICKVDGVVVNRKIEV